MNFRSYSLLSLLSLFFLTFDLKVAGFIGSAFISFFISMGCFFVRPHLFFKNLGKIFKCFSYFFVLYIFFLIFIFLRILISGDDYSYLLTTLKTTFILIATVFYLASLKKDNLFKNFLIIFFINALVCIFFGTFPEYKLILNYVQYSTTEGSNDLIGMNEYRNAFLAGSGYFGIASLYCLISPVLIYYMYINNNLLIRFKFILIMAAGVLAGRVTLLCYGISFLLFGVYYRKLNILILFLFFIVLGYFLLNYLPFLEDVNAWISELYSQDDINDSGTIQQLKSMFYFPSEFTLLWGDGKYEAPNGAYYGNTDVGYMRNILFGGVGFLLLLLANFFSIFSNVKFNFLILGVIFISLLLHFKGVFIFNNPGFFPIILSIVYSIYLSNIGGKE
ncbi:hypothetical protein EA763_11435 [Acinetobacter lactucae]|nr:hypothetical protein EA763_11435 [Acinetobacter lactucae]